MTDRPTAMMMFAAGFGTRMRHLTQERPKPLIEVAGKPLVQHTLDLARAVAPAPIVANLHYKAEQLEPYLTSRDVICVKEHPEILETGGGLRNALPRLAAPVVYTTNTDAIWKGPNPFVMLQQAWDPEIMDALLLCIPHASAFGHAGKGDFTISKDGKLARGTEVIYGGVQILKTERLGSVPDAAFSLNVTWDQMLANGTLCGITYPGRWCDVGQPEGIAQAETLLADADV